MLDCDDVNWRRPIPIFPLPNCVLFPGVVLPLHVFEPRYKEMMQAVTARDALGRLVAMALLRDGWEPYYHTRRAPIHPVVCVGRVIQHEALPDGCFNLLLLGLHRATLVVETGEGLYRQALLSPVGNGANSFNDERLRKLLHRVVLHLGRQAGGLARSTIESIFDNAPNTDILVDVLAYHLVPAERAAFKQTLLEEPHAQARAQKLLRHLRAVLTDEAQSGGPWPPPMNLN